MADKALAFAGSVLVACVALAMSIYAVVYAVKAQDALDTSNSEYGELITHWKTQPAMDVTLVSTTETCPSGYAESPNRGDPDDSWVSNIGLWPGTDAWCDCPTSGSTYKSHIKFYKCDCGSGRSYTYETTDSSGNKVTRTATAYSSSCAENGGSCSATQSSAGCTPNVHCGDTCRTNTQYSSSGACPSQYTSTSESDYDSYCGYQQMGYCGTVGSFPAVDVALWRDYKICYKHGGDSVWTRPAFKESSGVVECLSNGYRCGAGSYGTVLSNDCPVVNPSVENRTVCAWEAAKCPMSGAFDWSTIGSGNTHSAGTLSTLTTDANTHDGTKGLPIIEFRMVMGSAVCKLGSEGISGRAEAAQVKRSGSWSNYNGGCSNNDERYILWDALDEATLLSSNFAKYQTDTGTQVRTGGVPIKTSTSYGTGGTVSTSPYVHYDSTTAAIPRSSYSWSLFYRREIEWTPDCKAGTIADLEAYEDPLGDLTDIQRALLACVITFSLVIVAVCLSGMELTALYCNDGEPEKGMTWGFRIATIVAKVAVFIPTVLALVKSSKVHSFFQTAANTICTDCETSATLRDVAEAIDVVHNDNRHALIACCVAFALFFLRLLWAFRAELGACLSKMWCSCSDEASSQHDDCVSIGLPNPVMKCDEASGVCQGIPNNQV